MGNAAAESAFNRELLFRPGRFKTKTMLKVDQLISIEASSLLQFSPALSYLLSWGRPVFVRERSPRNVSPFLIEGYLFNSGKYLTCGMGSLATRKIKIRGLEWFSVINSLSLGTTAARRTNCTIVSGENAFD